MRNENQLKSDTSFDSIRANLDEAAQIIKEISRETKEMQKETKEMKKEMKKETREMKKESKEFKQRIDEMIAESRRERKELNQQLGGISNSNGEMAETYFYNAFKAHRYFANEHYDHVQRPARRTNGDIEAEYDIILFNGKSVVIMEVKYNAKPDNIHIDHVISSAETFKILFPEYKNHKIYLAIAAMTFRSGVERKLHRAGIATIRQIGKKMVVYDKEVRAF